MLVVLQRAWIRSEIQAILADERLDEEEKFEALSALSVGRETSEEAMIRAAKEGVLKLACQPGLLVSASGRRAPE
jgi:hypothetical protein